MKPLLLLLLSILIIATIIEAIPTYRNKILQSLIYSDCDTPLQYQLGSIDPKFGLSNSEVIQDIKTATAIWSNEEGKNLFMYAPGAPLTVNFVYDERAALNTQINDLQSQLSQSDTTLKQQIAQYESESSAFDQKLAAFKAEVDKYNAQGGAPKDVYDQLIKEQQDLNTEAQALNQKARQLNLSTKDYNSNVSVLNGDINQFQSELAQKPEEGLYNGPKDTITIYFANNHDELIHTLTHEFGHALGMIHVSDPRAIMYPYTTKYTRVTPEDLQQLQYVCRDQSLFIHAIQEADLWIATVVQNLKLNFLKSK